MLENNTDSNEILLRGAVQALLLRRVDVDVADADADSVAVHTVRCLNHDLPVDAVLSPKDM